MGKKRTLIRSLESELKSYTGRRLIVRTVDVKDQVNETWKQAIETGKMRITSRHGGEVCNNYGYPAETEGCVVIAWPDGTLAAKVCRLPANKVTHSGVVAHCMGELYRPIFDERYGSRTKKVILDMLERKNVR